MAVFMYPSSNTAMTISSDERIFFVHLGARIAQLRRDNDITQAQLAEALQVSQQTIQAYEVGRRRIPVSALPVLARLLSVSLEELFGEQEQLHKKPGPISKWQQRIEAIAQLPKSQQRLISQMIDTILAQQH